MTEHLHAVKLLAEADGQMRVGGYGIVWGGQDVAGDYFDKSTDLMLEPDRRLPCLYQHGRDGELGGEIIGQVVVKRIDSVGLWIEAQLSLASKYAAAIKQLIARGVLGWSSGAVSHMVQRVKMADGRAWLERWPVAEFSLTPTPCEPRTLGVQAMKALLAADSSLAALLGPDADLRAEVAEVDAFLAETKRWLSRDELVCGPDEVARLRAQLEAI